MAEKNEGGRGPRKNSGGRQGQAGGGPTGGAAAAPAEAQQPQPPKGPEKQKTPDTPRPKNLLEKGHNFYTQATIERKGGRIVALSEPVGKDNQIFEAEIAWWPNKEGGKVLVADPAAKVNVLVIEHRGKKFAIVVEDKARDSKKFEELKEQEFTRRERLKENVEYGEGEIAKKIQLEKKDKTAYQFVGKKEGAKQYDRLFEVQAAFPWPKNVELDLYIDTPADKVDKENYQAYVAVEVEVSHAYQHARDEYFRNKTLLAPFYGETGPGSGFEELVKDNPESRQLFLEQGNIYTEHLQSLNTLFLNVLDDLFEIVKIKSLDPKVVQQKVDDTIAQIRKELQQMEPLMKEMADSVEQMRSVLKDPENSVNTAAPLTEKQKQEEMMKNFQEANDPNGTGPVQSQDLLDAFMQNLEGRLREPGRKSLERERHGGDLFDTLKEQLEAAGITIREDAVFSIAPKDGAVLNITDSKGTVQRFRAPEAITEWRVAKNGGSEVVVFTAKKKELQLDLQRFIELVAGGDIAIVERSQGEADFVKALQDPSMPLQQLIEFLRKGVVQGYEQYNMNDIDSDLYKRVEAAIQTRIREYVDGISSPAMKAELAKQGVEFMIPWQVLARPGEDLLLHCRITVEGAGEVIFALTGDPTKDQEAFERPKDGVLVLVQQRIAERDEKAKKPAEPEAKKDIEKYSPKEIGQQLQDFIAKLDEYSKPGDKQTALKQVEALYRNDPTQRASFEQVRAVTGAVTRMQNELRRMQAAFAEIQQLPVFQRRASEEKLFEQTASLLTEAASLMQNIDKNVADLSRPARQQEAWKELDEIEKKYAAAIAAEASAREQLKMYLAVDESKRREVFMKNYQDALEKSMQVLDKVEARRNRLIEEAGTRPVEDIHLEKIRLKRLIARAEKTEKEARSALQALDKSDPKGPKVEQNEYIAQSLEGNFERAAKRLEELRTRQEMVEKLSELKLLNNNEAIALELKSRLDTLGSLSNRAVELAGKFEKVTELYPLPEKQKLTLREWLKYLPGDLEFPDGRRREFQEGTGEGVLNALSTELKLPLEGTPGALYITWNSDRGVNSGLHKGAVYRLTADDFQGGVHVAELIKGADGSVREHMLPEIIYYGLLIELGQHGMLAAGSPEGGPERGSGGAEATKNPEQGDPNRPLLTAAEEAGSPEKALLAFERALNMRGMKLEAMYEDGAFVNEAGAPVVIDMQRNLKSLTVDGQQYTYNQFLTALDEYRIWHKDQHQIRFGTRIEQSAEDRLSVLESFLEKRGLDVDGLAKGRMVDLRGRELRILVLPDAKVMISNERRRKGDKQFSKTVSVEELMQMIERGQITKFTESRTTQLPFDEQVTQMAPLSEQPTRILSDSEQPTTEIPFGEQPTMQAGAREKKEKQDAAQEKLDKLTRGALLAVLAREGFIAPHRAVENADIIHFPYDFETNTGQPVEVTFYPDKVDVVTLDKRSIAGVTGEYEYKSTEAITFIKLFATGKLQNTDRRPPTPPGSDEPTVQAEPQVDKNAPTEQMNPKVDLNSSQNSARDREVKREMNNYHRTLREEFHVRPSELRKPGMLFDARGTELTAEVYPFGENRGVKVTKVQEQQAGSITASRVIPYEDFFQMLRSRQLIIGAENVDDIDVGEVLPEEIDSPTEQREVNDLLQEDESVTMQAADEVELEEIEDKPLSRMDRYRQEIAQDKYVQSLLEEIPDSELSLREVLNKIQKERNLPPGFLDKLVVAQNGARIDVKTLPRNVIELTRLDTGKKIRMPDAQFLRIFKNRDFLTTDEYARKEALGGEEITRKQLPSIDDEIAVQFSPLLEDEPNDTSGKGNSQNQSNRAAA